MIEVFGLHGLQLGRVAVAVIGGALYYVQGVVAGASIGHCRRAWQWAGTARETYSTAEGSLGR